VNHATKTSEAPARILAPPVRLFGIDNCDQVRKAKSWLNRHSLVYVFHDFRKQGLEVGALQAWLRHIPWDALLNKRGQTWRQLDESRRALITDQTTAIDVMLEHPTLIKRPILVQGDDVLVGFSEAVYGKHFPTDLKPLER
jgi:arsenate reductase (glutaredoxin)